jgi:hypothetical protein
MPSYQDIESRLRTVEELIDFIASTFRMKAMVSTGLLDQNGNPQGRQFDASLKELFYLSKQLPTQVQVENVDSQSSEPANPDA